MVEEIENWRTQIRKGYLELCLLALIESGKQMYGFELLDVMGKAGLPIKEGTLYPLLNRMTADGLLTAKWQTEEAKGHPRKFYSLTKAGRDMLAAMRTEFARMNDVYSKL